MPISFVRLMFLYRVANSIRKEFAETEFVDSSENGDRAALSVGLHVHVEELNDDILGELRDAVSSFPADSTALITTDSLEKQARISNILVASRCDFTVVLVSQSQASGLGLLTEALPRLGPVDLICHLHTRNVGKELIDSRRQYLWRNLAGSWAVVNTIIQRFVEDAKVGATFPPTYPTSEPSLELVGRRGFSNWFRRLESIVGKRIQACGKEVRIGDMFWIRRNAIKPYLDENLAADLLKRAPDDRQATAIDQSWGSVVVNSGYRTHRLIVNENSQRNAPPTKTRLLVFVSFHPGGMVTPAVQRMLRELRSETTKTIVVFNGALAAGQRERFVDADEVMERENKGYDFGAWRDVLLSRDRQEFQQYDELILANDSVVCSGRSVGRMFDEMDKRDCDFWGVTEHPEIRVLGSSWEPELSFGDILQAHLQSYFLVFRRRVVASDFFWDYWTNLPLGDSYAEVVIHNEVRTTSRFELQGFKRGCYLRESIETEGKSVLNQCFLAERNLILGSPFIKRKFLRQATKSRLELIASKLPADVD